MIPNVAKRGISFKGAAAYYLHDKKQEGETVRTSSERIDWTQTRNIMTENPNFAIKIMAATAMDKDRLKAQAGIKNTGQKSKGDVYVYSLSWHPEETGKFDKAQMLDAVDQSLKSIGGQDHQAVIVAHNDEPHPHVHIILNLVHPDTGKNLALSHDFKKLEKWGHEYRKARGEENRYCPNRTKKMDAIDARKRGEDVPFVRGNKAIARNAFNDVAALKMLANKHDIKTLMEGQKKKDFVLIQEGGLMNSRHKAQWDALKDNYSLKKDFISKTYKEDKASLKSELYAQNKPLFSEVYRQQWKETKNFERREKRILGKLENIIKAVQYSNSLGKGSNEGILNMAFNFISKTARRENYIEKKQATVITQMRRAQGTQVRKAVLELNEARKINISAARKVFAFDRQNLIDTQNQEKKQLQSKWKQRNERRKEALGVLKKKEALQVEAKNNAVPDEKEPLNDEFKQVGRKTGRKRTPRTRGRSRSRD